MDYGRRVVSTRRRGSPRKRRARRSTRAETPSPGTRSIKIPTSCSIICICRVRGWRPEHVRTLSPAAASGPRRLEPACLPRVPAGRQAPRRKKNTTQLGTRAWWQQHPQEQQLQQQQQRRSSSSGSTSRSSSTFSSIRSSSSGNSRTSTLGRRCAPRRLQRFWEQGP